MTPEEINKLKRKKLNATKKSMKEIGVYRKEFDPSIERYAEMSAQYACLNEQWYESGCKITENYTNKAGATNPRKTALYLSIESLRKELIELENLLGLTPKGLKMIRSKGLESKRESKLNKILEEL